MHNGHVERIVILSSNLGRNLYLNTIHKKKNMNTLINRPIGLISGKISHVYLIKDRQVI